MAVIFTSIAKKNDKVIKLVIQRDFQRSLVFGSYHGMILTPCEDGSIDRLQILPGDSNIFSF